MQTSKIFTIKIFSKSDSFYGTLKKYPKYISGGGFLVNWKAVRVLQEQIPKNPVIPIDDAFIGVCMYKAGLSLNLGIETFMFINY